MSKYKSTSKSYKCLLRSYDGKFWHVIAEWKGNLHSTIAAYMSRNPRGKTAESMWLESVAVRDWDGSRPLVLPMPKDWAWMGKELAFAVGVHTISFNVQGEA